MLHRFAARDLGIEGHDGTELRRVLGQLRREGYALLSLREIVSGLRAGTSWWPPAVGFTIDDGYWDHAHVAAPIFAEFDCPVTTFVTTGFLDGELWFWWDRIAYVFEHTLRTAVSFDFGGERLTVAWSSRRERLARAAEITARCTTVSDSTKHQGIAALATAAEVTLPSKAPSQYAPMSWADLRRAERSGMTFGPHTITHPILSRTTDAQAYAEVVGSWRRLRLMATAPVPIFCYPNGSPADFGRREIAACFAAGLEGAVVGTAGYASIGPSLEAPYRINRFAYEDTLTSVVECASGVERLRNLGPEGW